MAIITIHMHKNDGLEKKKKKKKFFLYFHIREVLSHSRECGSWAAFPGGSRMIREGSHVCSYAYESFLEPLHNHHPSLSLPCILWPSFVINLYIFVYFCHQEKQEVAAGNLMFLMDYAYITKDDILLNNNTFSWAERIVPMITSA